MRATFWSPFGSLFGGGSKSIDIKADQNNKTDVISNNSSYPIVTYPDLTPQIPKANASINPELINASIPEELPEEIQPNSASTGILGWLFKGLFRAKASLAVTNNDAVLAPMQSNNNEPNYIDKISPTVCSIFVKRIIANEDLSNFITYLNGLKNKSNINLNLQDAEGYTALHHAIILENEQAAEWLLANGAKTDIKSDAYLTPLDYAITTKSTSLELVLQHSSSEFINETITNPTIGRILEGDENLEVNKIVHEHLNDLKSLEDVVGVNKDEVFARSLQDQYDNEDIQGAKDFILAKAISEAPSEQDVNNILAGLEQFSAIE